MIEQINQAFSKEALQACVENMLNEGHLDVETLHALAEAACVVALPPRELLDVLYPFVHSSASVLATVYAHYYETVSFHSFDEVQAHAECVLPGRQFYKTHVVFYEQVEAFLNISTAEEPKDVEDILGVLSRLSGLPDDVHEQKFEEAAKELCAMTQDVHDIVEQAEKSPYGCVWNRVIQLLAQELIDAQALTLHNALPLLQAIRKGHKDDGIIACTILLHVKEEIENETALPYVPLKVLAHSFPKTSRPLEDLEALQKVVLRKGVAVCTNTIRFVEFISGMYPDDAKQVACRMFIESGRVTNVESAYMLSCCVIRNPELCALLDALCQQNKWDFKTSDTAEQINEIDTMKHGGVIIISGLDDF